MNPAVAICLLIALCAFVWGVFNFIEEGSRPAPTPPNEAGTPSEGKFNPYYLSPILAYMAVGCASWYVLGEYLGEDERMFSIFIVALFIHFTLLEFWVFVDVVKAALILNELTGNQREATTGWNPKLPLIEVVRQRADRDLGNKTVKVLLTVPTMGDGGHGGPTIDIIGVITYRETVESLQTAITYDEKSVKEGSEQIAKREIQAKIGITKIKDLPLRWATPWEDENLNPKTQKPLLDQLEFAFTAKRVNPTTGRMEDLKSTFEDRYGFKCVSADFSYVYSGNYQKTLDNLANGEKVLALAAEIFKQSKGKMAWAKAFNEAKVAMELVIEKRYTGNLSSFVMDYLASKDKSTGGRGKKPTT